ncbi:MAG: hypothetical protein M3O70_24365, partial [Actinomycetota bacterium]|nr:hypothetical protein [Actinomycetota bacterium]
PLSANGRGRVPGGEGLGAPDALHDRAGAHDGMVSLAATPFTDTLVQRLGTDLLAATSGTIEGHRFGALAWADHLELLNRQLKRPRRPHRQRVRPSPRRGDLRELPRRGRGRLCSLLAELGEDGLRRSRRPGLSGW